MAQDCFGAHGFASLLAFLLARFLNKVFRINCLVHKKLKQTQTWAI